MPKRAGSARHFLCPLFALTVRYFDPVRKCNLKEISENIDMSDSSADSSCKEDKDAILERVRALFGSEVSKLFEGKKKSATTFDQSGYKEV